MLKKALLISFLFCCSAGATSVSLEYKNFYNRLKQVRKGDYSAVTIGFYVPQTPDCLIKSGSITTENNKYPLSYSEFQELLLPYDEKLKKDRALINLVLAGDANKCGIEMQVNATPKSKIYDKSRLDTIYGEMNQLMSAMQGFPLKYFSNDINGITFQFSEPAAVKIDDKFNQETRSYKIDKQKIDKLSSLTFSSAPIKVSPWVK